MNSIAPAILVMGALACILLALALWLFARAQRSDAQRSIDSNMQRSLEIQRDLQASSTLVMLAASKVTVAVISLMPLAVAV